jgi:hypothetical protein
MAADKLSFSIKLKETKDFLLDVSVKAKELENEAQPLSNEAHQICGSVNSNISDNYLSDCKQLIALLREAWDVVKNIQQLSQKEDSSLKGRRKMHTGRGKPGQS